MSQEELFKFTEDEKIYLASQLDEETLLLAQNRDEAISVSIKSFLESRANITLSGLFQ